MPCIPAAPYAEARLPYLIGVSAMAFVQVIEFRSSRIDEMEGVVAEWEKATEGKRAATTPHSLSGPR